MIIRTLLLSLVAAGLALVAVRSAAGEARASSPLAAARSFFPAQSAIAADRAMAGIGIAARSGKALSPEAKRDFNRIARNAPLRVEPFLAVGAEAAAAGQGDQSERLFLAARARDPRAPAARYFLADRYLRTQREVQGLVEMAALSRLQPRLSDPLAPAIIAYLQMPGAVGRVRQFFERDDSNRERVLNLLSANAANADVILALAPSVPMPATAEPPAWQVQIVTMLAAAGRGADAQRVWERLSGLRRSGLVVDGDLRKSAAPPPFGWALGQDSGGVAQFGERGGIEIVHYGRTTVDYARQLINAGPGRYRLGSTIVEGARSPALRLVLQCYDGRVIGDVEAGAQGDVTIPAGCGSPWLKISGVIVSSPQTVEATIGSVRMEPVAA